VLFSEAEYEEFKAKMVEKRKNRLYVSWRNRTTQQDCRQVGPFSRCRCGHDYKSHATDEVATRRVRCRTAGCGCAVFSFVPLRGTQDVKCSGCRHSVTEHARGACAHAACKCGSFATSLSCACGARWAEHDTMFELREERVAAGRPVDNLADGGRGYEALGGVTNFSSLLEGDEQRSAAASLAAQYRALEAPSAPPPAAPAAASARPRPAAAPLRDAASAPAAAPAPAPAPQRGRMAASLQLLKQKQQRQREQQAQVPPRQ
jgi:hypothetical protein